MYGGGAEGKTMKEEGEEDLRGRLYEERRRPVRLWRSSRVCLWPGAQFIACVCACMSVCACVAEKCEEEAVCLNIHFCSLSNPGTAAGIKGGS